MSVYGDGPLSTLGTVKVLALASHLDRPHRARAVSDHGEVERRTYPVLAVGVVIQTGHDHGVAVASANGVVVESRSAHAFDEGVSGEASPDWGVEVSQNAGSERAPVIETWTGIVHTTESDGEVGVIWCMVTVTACDRNGYPFVESGVDCGYDEHDWGLCYQVPWFSLCGKELAVVASALFFGERSFRALS